MPRTKKQAIDNQLSASELTSTQVKNAYQELKNEDRNDKIIDEAYRHNFKLVPLPVDFNKGQGKRLLVKGWNTDFNDISKEDFEEYMKENLKETKYWNYAILTGERSKVLVLDFDIPRQDNKKPANYGKNWLNNQLKLWNIKPKDIKTPIVETGSGGIHLYFQWEDRFKNLSNSLYYRSVQPGDNQRSFDCNIKIEGIDILKNGKNAIYPNSVYIGCITPDEEEKGKKHKCKNSCLKECEFKGEFYRWKEGKSPDDIPIGKIGDVLPQLEKFMLIDDGPHCGQDKKEKEPGDGTSPFVVITDEMYKEIESDKGQLQIKEYLDLLEDRADDYESWISTCFCILGSGYNKKWVHYFSKKSDKYDEEYTEKNIIEKFDPSKNKYTFSSMVYWIEQIHGENMKDKLLKKYASKEEQKQNTEKKITSLKQILLKDKKDISSNEWKYLWNRVFSKKEKTIYGFVFSILAKDDIKLVDEKSLAGYIYNPETALWEHHLDQYISNLVPKYIEEYVVYSYIEVRNALVCEFSKIEIGDDEDSEDEDGSGDPSDKEARKNAEMEKKLKNLDNEFEKVKQNMLYNTTSKKDILKEALNDLLQKPNFFDSFNLPAYLLPIKNKKILDLRTKEVRRRTKEDLFNFEINVEYKKFDKYDEVEKFFDNICCQDKELSIYLKELSGYFMTGEISDRGFYIFYGKGKNGKSSYDNLLEIILGRGEYYNALSDDAILKKKNKGGPTPELMNLKHSRLAVLPETDEDAEMNATRIKKLTGGDVMTGRALFMNEVSFKPRAKFTLITNFKPKFNHRDRAILDRIRCIPFNARFEDKDKVENNKFIEELKGLHLEQVFSYFVEGAYTWYSNNKSFTKIPKICEEALEKYREENKDTFDLWINDNIQLEENTGEFERRILDKKATEYEYYLQSEELEKSYTSWCRDKDEAPLKLKQVQQLLTQYLGEKKSRRIPIEKYDGSKRTTTNQPRNVYLGVLFKFNDASSDIDNE
jgi:P4 family phage/plasmid primase-like protien